LELRGIFSNRSAFFRIFFLVLIILFFGSLAQLMAMGLGQAIYDMTLEDVVGPDGWNGYTASSRNYLRLMQFLTVSGIFIAGPSVFVYLAYAPPSPTGIRSHTHFQPLLVVVLLMVTSGFVVNGLVELADVALSTFLSKEAYDSIVSQHLEALSQTGALLYSEGIAEYASTFLIIVALPALAEEYFFRGVLQEEFKRIMGPKGAITLTALLFALIHWQWLNFVGLFAFGWLLGYLKERTQSLWYPIVAHFVNNGTVLVALWMSEGSWEDSLVDVPSAPLWQYGLALLLSGVLIWVFHSRTATK
jgi:hypothetical protein